MALFQPTNVIPSSFTVGVVDAMKDVAQISWQVNGNSAMTAYEILFYRNNENSTPLLFANTGKITDGIPVGGFYGTDRFGRPRMFTWKATENKTWNEYYSTFSNGEQFKFKIRQYWNGNGGEQSVTEVDFNVFSMMATPIVSIYTSDRDYESANILRNGTTLATSIGYFKAEYTQEQGSAVRWARWQIATAELINTNWTVGEIISDTGEVNTPTLQFEFNGFFNQQSYAVRCIIESENGQQAQNAASQEEGWVFFTIDIVSQSEYGDVFTLQCVRQENVAMLKWTSDETATTTTGGYSVDDGHVKLDPLSTIHWEKDGGFKEPWTFAVELQLLSSESFVEPLLISGEHTSTFNTKGTIKSVTFEPVLIGAKTQISEDGHSCQITFPKGNISTPSVTVTFLESIFSPTGIISRLNMGAHAIELRAGVTFPQGKYSFSLIMDGVLKEDIPLENASQVAILITPSRWKIYKNDNNEDNSYEMSFRHTQETLDSVEITGGDNGATYNCVTVYKGDVPSNILDELYSNVLFKPTWDADNYSLYMSANFNGTIDGGKVSKYRIYRQEVGKNSLSPIYYSKIGGISELKDFGIASRKSYTYWLYEYDKNDGYLKGTQCTLPDSNVVATIRTNFKNYSLLVCDYDSENDAYHVRKQYLFALNLSEGSVGNNNSPTLNANFTAYPTRMPSTQNYASGKLQGLIGVVYTVPALIEQIGGIKLVQPSTLDYFDDVDLEKELYDLSIAPYQLFLRDMKGHLRMIATNGAISMTTNLKQRQQSISISLPWVEIGDASDVTIIQTPDDYGWNNDNQVLDVRLDIDPQNGVLSAVYPKPYNGTKFYLTGVHKEILSAETPMGVAPAKFNLSETASNPEDGMLTATVNINSEEA